MRRPLRTPRVSVVVPAFNEEESLPEFIRRVEAVLRSLRISFEVILVNDGSSDRTLDVAVTLSRRHRFLRVMNLSRNFGHQMAATAGIDIARGAAVVLIDADLQDPPEIIRDMYGRWKEGADVVYGQRRSRQGETSFKLLTARVFYRLMRMATSVKIPVDTGDFRLMDRKVVDTLKRLRERHRFIRGMVSWVGFRQESVLYDRNPRYAGTTHYPLRKMLVFSIDAITSFSILPLRLLTLTGLCIVSLSILFSLFVLVVKLLNPEYFLPGFSTIVLLMTFFGGMQLLSLGVIGEYVGRVFEEIKRRPLFIVDQLYEGGLSVPLPPE